MLTIGTISAIVVHWLETVAAVTATLINRVASSPIVALTEDKDGALWLRTEPNARESEAIDERLGFEGGRIVGPAPDNLKAIFSRSRVELTLQSHRFLFQQMELPGRAVEFLDGIVRTQLDQLTPWTATEAAFGWTKPSALGTDRVLVTVVAGALASLQPHIQALSELGARSISLFTRLEQDDSDAPPIKLLFDDSARSFPIERIRRLIIILFAATGLGPVTCMGLSAIVSSSLDAQQLTLNRKIAATRRSIPDIGEGGIGPGTLREAAQRKHDIPSLVAIIDTLSQILPDDTYVLSLHLDGKKLQLTGVTRDAASLIGIIEKSGRFSHATFFGPTTKVASEPGERFHIETQIMPFAGSS